METAVDRMRAEIAVIENFIVCVYMYIYVVWYIKLTVLSLFFSVCKKKE